jgi:RNA-binding protein
MVKLSPAQRQYLKGLAHPKQPVVMIGDKGLTESVMKEIDRALIAHELIKIKASSEERGMRESWLDQVCKTLSAAPVQVIGKMLVVYRPSEKAVIRLPD